LQPDYAEDEDGLTSASFRSTVFATCRQVTARPLARRQSRRRFLMRFPLSLCHAAAHPDVAGTDQTFPDVKTEDPIANVLLGSKRVQNSDYFRDFFEVLSVRIRFLL